MENIVGRSFIDTYTYTRTPVMKPDDERWTDGDGGGGGDAVIFLGRRRCDWMRALAARSKEPTEAPNGVITRAAAHR